jgi:protein TonB
VRAPESEPVSEPEPVVVPEPEPAMALEPEPMAAVPTEPVLQLPEIDRGFVLRVPDVPPADDESAVEVLERLVEPVPGPPSDVDPSVVRARLTRLAASKKPGPRTDASLGDARRGSGS